MRWLNEAIPNRRETAIGTALLACALLAAPAAAQPIDFFTDAAPPIVDPPPGAGAFSATPGATILGGERDAEVRLLSGPGPVTSATAAGGPLSFAVVTPPSSRAVLELQWDGADASPLLDPVGLGGVDFIAAGSNSLHLAFGAVTGVGEVIVDVYSSATLSSRSAGVVTGTGDLYFPFSSFLPTGSSGPAAFTSVGAVVVQIFADSDATFDVLLFDALGPAVEATSVAAEVIGDADGLADPGETLEYTVNVTGGGGVAEGAEYDDLLADPNLSAAFSVEATPLARDDLLEGVGNFDLTVAAPGLLANDVDPDGGTVTLDTAASDTVTAKGGTVSYPDGLGGFTYTPPVGFKGVDRFTYEIDDDEGDTTTGVATILIDELVWFVNNSAGGDTDGDVGCAPPPCGTGLLSDPFGDFSSLNGVSGDVDSPGDTIFVFEGSGSYDTGAAPGLPLEPGQTLIGEGVDLVVDGVTLVVGEPSSRPTLSNTAGTSGDAVTLATDNTIRGLDLGDVPAASSRLTDGGGGVGTLTIGDVSAASTGGVIDVTGGGTLAVTFDTIVSTSSSGTPAINLAGVGGTLTVSNPGAGLDTTISGADAGIDISGSVGAASFSFGETSVTTDATGGDGVSLTGNGGATTAFSSLDVTTGAGDALVTDSATVTIGGVSNTIAATGGAAHDASGTQLRAGRGSV
ncbi:MAG: Ig-like domain-containing protein, partial [Thermoanaerobaculia bacterium]|nr:Ig-like domain-containing protein [Thermoanaerobaculia bacterium]